MNRILAIFSALLLGLSLTTACGKQTAETGTSQTAENAVSKVPQVITYASTSDVVGLSPILTNDSVSSAVISQIYETLFSRDEDFNIVPLLADSYETPDENTWVIKLKQGIKFQDGTPFNAVAVEFTFERLLDPKVAAPRASLLKAVDSIEVEDDYTVVIHTKYPYGPMLAALAHTNASIVSPAAVAKYGDLQNNPVGTGPFIFKERVPGDHIILTRNQEYWREPAKLEKVTFKVVPEVSTAISMLETDEVDFIDGIPAELLKRLEDDPNIIVQIRSGTPVFYLGFNHKFKPLDNLKVREAIAHTIDVKAYVDTLEGLGVQSVGIIGPNVFGYEPSIEKLRYEYDLSTAKQLLAEAGYPHGFKIALYTPNTNEYMNMSEIIQDQLKKVGIDVSIKPMEWGAYLAATKKYEQQLFVLGWTNSTGDGSELVYPNLHPDNIGSSNRSNYDNPEIAGLIMQTRTTTDQKKRLALLNEVNEKLVKDVAWISMDHGVASVAFNKHVRNLMVLPNNDWFLYQVYKE